VLHSPEQSVADRFLEPLGPATYASVSQITDHSRKVWKGCKTFFGKHLRHPKYARAKSGTDESLLSCLREAVWGLAALT